MTLKDNLHFWIKVYPLYLVMRFLNIALVNEGLQKYYLNRILKYAYKHCLYYKHIFEQLNITDCSYKILDQIPLLSKSDIIKNKEYIYSDEIPSNYNNWANTGGSTGEPLSFPRLTYKTPYESAHGLYLYKEMGWKFRETIIAIDGSRVSEENLSKNVFWTEGSNFPYGRFAMSTLYMTDENLPFYIKFLNEINPKVLRGYPSGVRRICEYINTFKVPITFKLKGIYLTSERVTTEDRQYISNTLNCRVWGQYGHTEASIFSISQPGSDCYLSSPLYGFTEILDEKGKHVDIGEIGEVVVTGFANKGCPFIRYKTGDLAEYGGEKNGWIILNALVGRSIDYIINDAGEKIYLTGFIFGGHLRAFNYINDWQIKQTTPGFVTIKIVQSREWTSLYEEELYQLFNSKSITIKIEYVDSIPRSKRGKRIFMLQDLK